VKKATIDANFLLALIDKKDKWHPKAKILAKTLRKKKWEVIYLDCVLNEVISVLAKRLEERKESQDLVSLLESLENLVPKEKVEWLYPNVPDLYSNIVKLIKEKEGRLNFHDALIALFIKENNSKYLVSFDQDFDEVDWIVRINHEGQIK